jgi:iron complex outermembrane receptor protein
MQAHCALFPFGTGFFIGRKSMKAGIKNYNCMLLESPKFGRATGLLISVILWSVFFFIFTVAWPAAAATTDEVMALSLEDLVNIEVTSAARMPQKISQAAAAIHVVTSEDIRHSGATSIPEALRMVPGLQVARIDGNTWAITCRGFNEAFANKMLVLIDGRTVYTPLFAGVFWDVQDVMLEDVDRIEVIRGPGGTLWGANAVNGVINIMTKSARDTQGLLIAGGGGSEERGFGRMRYGGTFGDRGYYRIYAKYFDRDTGQSLLGEDAADDWRSFRGGFRAEWGDPDDDQVTLQGDAYSGSSGSVRPMSLLEAPYSLNTVGDSEFSGQNVLLRWQHALSETSNFSAQFYYDGTKRKDMAFNEKRDTLDFDFQHQFNLGERHTLVWGAGYRYTRDSIDDSFTVSGDPDSRADSLYSLFLQDNVMLIQDRLTFIVGSKFEHNGYTGLEIQPNARITWTPSIPYSIWAAVSRAVRTPSRLDHDSQINFGVFPMAPDVISYVSMMGDEDAESEDLIAYELGFRYQPKRWFNLDVTAFYNVYDSLITNEPQTPVATDAFPPFYVIFPLTADNKGSGETYGIEVAVDYTPVPWWQLKTSYSYLQMALHINNSSGAESFETDEGFSPQHQVSVLSKWDIGEKVEFDAWWRYVDSLPALDIPSYHTLDLRLALQLNSSLELAIVGQNLLDDNRKEFTSTTAISTGLARGFYAQLTGRFK